MRLLSLATLALVLLLAACGGGGSSGGGGGGGNNEADLQIPGAHIVDPAPSLPPGAVALTKYYEFDGSASSAALLTLVVTGDIPDGFKATWYSYEDGQWKSLQPAFPTGGTPPIVQSSFSPRPPNIIVLSEPK